MIQRKDFKNIYLIDRVANEDLFHHSHFSDVLWRIIRDNTASEDKTPFNVGIFGKWGVGKSSVIHLFKKHLVEWNNDKTKSKKYKLIEFKVWKFSENALRRKFIFTIGKSILGKERLNTLYTEVKAKKTLLLPLIAAPEHLLNAFQNWRGNFPWRLFKWLLFFGTIAIIIVIGLSLNLKWNWFHGFADFILLASTFYSPALLYSVMSYILKSINEARVTIAFDQFDSDEQFEEAFIDLMKSESNDIKIIFIDDLDRCSKEKVIQTLETIKTYLDVPTCIFIIACDDAVICNVVQKKREELCNEDGDGLEYLNKFFQYSIRIPPFLNQSMREYALHLLERKGNDLKKLGDIEEILRILIHSGVKTPRKAIVLINSFATDFEVVLMREEGGELHSQYISERLPALAFFVVLKIDFREFSDLLAIDNNLIKYILRIEEGSFGFIEDHHVQILKEIYDLRSELGEPISEAHYKSKKAEDFVLLVKSARDHISDIDDFSPFIYLQSDSSSIALPSERFRTLSSFLRDGITDKVKQMIGELKTQEELKIHFNVITKVLSDIKSAAERRKAYKVFFEIASLMPEDVAFRQHASNVMIKFFDITKGNSKWLEEFNINGVMFLLQYLRSEDQKSKVIKELVNALEKAKDKDLALRWIRAILVYPELVSSEESSRVRRILDRRAASTEDKEVVFFALLEICELINQFKAQNAALNKFFVGKVVDEIAERIISLEGVEKLDEVQEKEHSNLKQIFEILDTEILSQKQHLSRRIKVLTLFLPTKNYYYVVIEKVRGIISQLTEENSQGLLAGLVEEVPNVSSPHLKDLLSVIDEISSKYKSFPIVLLMPLVKFLPNIAIEKYGISEFEVSTDYFVKFINDQRISVLDAQSGYEQLMGALNSSEDIVKTQKISNFILQNNKQLNKETHQKFLAVFIREVLDLRTYDVKKFPNNEAIAYWRGVEEKVLDDSISDVDRLVIENIVNKGALSVTTISPDLMQKTILVDILKKPWEKYSLAAKEHFIRLIIPYLKDLKEENVVWGIENVYEVCSKMKSKAELSSVIQQEIISVLTLSLKVQNDIARRKMLSILLICDEEVIKLGGSVLSNMLEEIKYQLSPGKDNATAFEAFIKHHTLFTTNEQVNLCGLYLGSTVFSDDASKRLIEKIRCGLPVTPPTPLTKEVVEEAAITPKEVVAEQTQEAYIEKYLINISADERAWNFFAKLFTGLKKGIDSQILKEIVLENIRKLKNDAEPVGVCRNRFSAICALKNDGYYAEADMYGLLNGLFNEDTPYKVVLACDFFRAYFSDIRQIRDKDSRSSYRHTIKQAVERWKDDEALRNGLSSLLD